MTPRKLFEDLPGDRISIGFTGTQKGMTTGQEAGFRTLVRRALEKFAAIDFHHGDCVGADAQAHDLMLAEAGDRAFIHAHPCTITSKRAWRVAPQQIIYAPLPPLHRNKIIVNEASVLIATPGEREEQLRSGTWSTIRYARKCSVPQKIIYPAYKS